MDLKLIGLIALGAISVWLRWSSPEQMKARKLAKITKLESQVKKLKGKRDALLAKKHHDLEDAIDLSNCINNISKLQQEINNLKRQ